MLEYDYLEHHAADLSEALALAERLCQSGTYDLFRGQRRTYDLVPTALREGVDLSEVNVKLNDFASWVHQMPDLSSLHGDLNGILAVAQHYGMKTPFLDFSYSPKIAGFFASDRAEEGDIGTLICINKSRFSESWRDLNQRYFESEGRILTEIVELNVKNLWRLQAQQGAFLRCQVDPTMLEMFSHMLHIYFPQKPGLKICDRREIYPEERSHLEVLLDQYFLIDKYPERIRQMAEFFDTTISSVTEDRVTAAQASFFIGKRIPAPHSSWSSADAKDWLTEPDEKFGPDTRVRRVTLTLPEGAFDHHLTDDLENEILDLIDRGSCQRTRANLDWNVVFITGNTVFVDSEGSLVSKRDEFTAFKLSEMVNVIYSGMRYLPYSTQQIARAISRYVVMAKYGCYTVIDDAEGVEFEGASIRGRGFCSRNNVISAIRRDFYGLVDPSKLDSVGAMDFRDTLFAASKVKAGYDFEGFLRLFVEDLIPSQAAIAIEGLVIGLNPMRIDVLGES